MQKNSQNFDLQEALRLVQSPAGQQLLAMLRQTGRFDQAADQAKAGNYSEALESLRDVISSPQGQQLLKQLRR